MCPWEPKPGEPREDPAPAGEPPEFCTWVAPNGPVMGPGAQSRTGQGTRWERRNVRHDVQDPELNEKERSLLKT